MARSGNEMLFLVQRHTFRESTLRSDGPGCCLHGKWQWSRCSSAPASLRATNECNFVLSVQMAGRKVVQALSPVIANNLIRRSRAWPALKHEIKSFISRSFHRRDSYRKASLLLRDTSALRAQPQLSWTIANNQRIWEVERKLWETFLALSFSDMESPNKRALLWEMSGLEVVWHLSWVITKR